MSRTRYFPDHGATNHVFASATRVSIYLVTLTFDLLTLTLVRIISRGVGNLTTNFCVPVSFRSRLMGQHLSEHHVA